MDDQAVIREQMADTRNAISEKLEILEDRVSSTVQGATQEVAESVEYVTDSVQETVANVKETVDDTLSAVKDGVDSIKEIFDLPRHVERHPWIAVGGSLALGYFLGEFLIKSGRPSARRIDRVQTPRRDSLAAETQGHNGQANGSMDHGENGSAPSASLLSMITPELSDLKALAVGALIGTVRDMIAQAAGESLGQPLREIIDSVTKKIGGKPIAAKPLASDAP